MCPLVSKTRVGCLICVMEVNIMCVPCDSRPIIHLLTIWSQTQAPHTIVSRGEIAVAQNHDLLTPNDTVPDDIIFRSESSDFSKIVADQIILQQKTLMDGQN